MSFSAEFLFAAAIAGAAFLVGVLLLRSRARRTRSVGLKPSTEPRNLRYKCAGCSGQFTHTRRTLAAWQRGERNFHCRACMTKAAGERKLPGSKVRTRR